MYILFCTNCGIPSGGCIIWRRKLTDPCSDLDGNTRAFRARASPAALLFTPVPQSDISSSYLLSLRLTPARKSMSPLLVKVLANGRAMYTSLKCNQNSTLSITIGVTKGIFFSILLHQVTRLYRT